MIKFLIEDIENKYRDNKSKALEATEKNPMTAGQVKYREQRDISLYLLRKLSKMTYEQIANLLSEYDLEMSYVQVRNICAKFGDIEKKKVETTEKEGEKKVNVGETVEKDVKMTENEDIGLNIDDLDDF